MLDYRKTYLVTDMTNSIDPPHLIGIAPRLFTDGELPTLQYMTVSDSPGSNAHAIHHPKMKEQEDGSVVVMSPGTDMWRFRILTLDLWNRHFADTVDSRVNRHMTSDGSVQHYFWEQFVDEDHWPENPV